MYFSHSEMEEIEDEVKCCNTVGQCICECQQTSIGTGSNNFCGVNFIELLRMYMINNFASENDQ